MDEIAAGASVTKPILYRTIGDKAALVAALSETLIDQIDRSVTTATSAATGALTAFEAAIRGYVQAVEADRNIFLFVNSAAPGTDQFRRLVDRSAASMVEVFSAARSQRRPRLRWRPNVGVGDRRRAAGGDHDVVARRHGRPRRTGHRRQPVAVVGPRPHPRRLSDRCGLTIRTVIENGTVLDTTTMDYVGEQAVVIGDVVIVEVSDRFTGDADVVVDAAWPRPPVTPSHLGSRRRATSAATSPASSGRSTVTSQPGRESSVRDECRARPGSGPAAPTSRAGRSHRALTATLSSRGSTRSTISSVSPTTSGRCPG